MRHKITLILLIIGSFTISSRSQTTSTATKLDAATIYERAVQSVVLVICSKSDGKVAQGSGVILRKDGVIATNFHVCGDAVGGRIKLHNGDIYDDVSILDSDERKDISILKIKAMNLPSLNMADSDQLKIGSNVFAIGCPLGLEGSITSGIISSIRPVNEMFSWTDGFRIFQISVAVTHGSSGCPLLNESGEVVGLVFAGRQEGQNVNAAIPINYVSPLVNSSKEATALKQLGNFETRNVSLSAQPPKKDSYEDLAGVYVGQWGSDRYSVSGNLAMTLAFTNGVPKITAVFTGSEYLSQDELESTFTPMGAGVWKMDYVGKKSKMKGTGLFKNGRFVGDYKFKKFIWTDVGKWVLDISRD